MMWKWCVVLVMLSAWQACSAQKLVNLVQPHLTETVPQPWPANTRYWKLFDYDKSTYETVRRGKYGQQVDFSIQYPYSIRPTKYRIIMAAHVPSADYPSSWTVTRRFNSFNSLEVSGAVFKDGVYEGTFSELIDMNELHIRFDREVVTIAEIELLGPQSALDALWPYGDYPCSQRLAVITSTRGPKKIFSKSKNSVSQADLRVVFNAKEDWDADAEFTFDGAKPVIIGAKLPSLPMVQEVSVDAFKMRDRGVKKVVLQGNLCENDHCHKFGSKGWVRLGVGRPLRCCGVTNGPRIFVKNPGEYKAYRLKFIPKIGHPYAGWPSFAVAGLSLLGCTA